MSIRKNDTVMVIAGKDKGKTGRVMALFPDIERATVESINKVKRHQKPTQKMKQGGIVDKEASLHLSNLMIYCAACKKGVRTGVQEEKGIKKRICRKCRAHI